MPFQNNNNYNFVTNSKMLVATSEINVANEGYFEIMFFVEEFVN
jgi:hypothetical protein